MNKILVIDDDVNTCNMIAKYLTKQGYEVLMANNGKEGLNLVKSENPDLIITDIVMPVMNGIEFIYELKKNNIDNIPFIAMSGHEIGKEKFNSAYFLGAVETIKKPFDLEELKDMIEKII